MNGAGKVLIAAPVHAVLTEALQAAGYKLIHALDITQTSASALLVDCVGVVTSTRLQLDEALLDAAPRLRWIGRMGSGMEVIDVPYATSKGITCISSPEGNMNAVAEHALGLLLGITKKIAHSAGEVKRGLWLREENRGVELEGKTIGIIGFGHTGRAFAKKLQGMDMQILAYDIEEITDVPEYVSVCKSLEEIKESAKILSFHVQIDPNTHHYLDSDFVDSMKWPFILLNTSRGAVVDSEALLKGLEEGKVIGAGLDVWEEEPISKMSARSRGMLEKILGYPTVIVTPHIAGYSEEALFKMSEVLRIKILALTVL
jgi:D-3-phosphoglycerate dehydrogenase / 2-oxoglutarate reductase